MVSGAMSPRGDRRRPGGKREPPPKRLNAQGLGGVGTAFALFIDANAEKALVDVPEKESQMRISRSIAPAGTAAPRRPR